MVKKAIQFITANGRDKAFAEFSNTKGRFVDRDLHIAVLRSGALPTARSRTWSART